MRPSLISDSAMGWAAIRASGASGRCFASPEPSTTNVSSRLWWLGASMRSVGTPQAWDPEVIEQAIPLLPETLRNGSEKAADDGEPPVQLSPKATRVWRGEEPKMRDSGQLDRSGTLMKIGRELYDAGGNRPVIVAALKERDEALGYRKYSERQDSEARYQEIVDVLERTGRNPRMRMLGNGGGEGE